MRCYSLCCGEYSRHLPTEARKRIVFGSHFEWRRCCGPAPDKFGEKFNLSTVTDRQRETGEAKVRQGDDCDCVPLGCPHGQPSKLGLCAAQLGVHNDREITEGNFSLIFGIRILDSQSKMET